jgi:hypothetical protein
MEQGLRGEAARELLARTVGLVRWVSAQARACRLLAARGLPRTEGPAPDRRGGGRVSPKPTARVALRLSYGHRLLPSLLDLSRGGAGVLADRPLAPGQHVEVILGTLWLAGPVRRPATVAWCMEVDEGRHAAGLRFDEPLTPAELRSLAYGEDAS